ncbi:uncharacterized protein LOC142165921 [Nicotiana tabacum]|uniref:Uncharacterized protein LOC142165921 n=1 Tax=Nicotiana tabacum TaxID=4097 RepID=A0AC58S602_TOBAC
MYFNNSGNRKGIGFQKENTPYNPHNKYVTVPDNWLCTHCGNNGHFKENWQDRVQSVQKNKVFTEKVTTKEGPVRGSTLQWIMDSGCSKHMIGSTMDFLSLKALQERNVSFEKWGGYILGNKVEFLSKVCTFTNLVTGEVVLVAKRYKNIYVADFESLQAGDMRCLKSVDDDAEHWHRILGHASFSLLNKLIQKDLVRALPNSRFTWTLFLRTKDETFEVFVAFVKKIQVKMELKVACIISDHGTKFDNAKFDESLLNKIPYELINGKKPKITHLRTFGCKCYVLNNGKDQLEKFDAKSDEGILLGYSPQSKAYKVYNKRAYCVEGSVHVLFNETPSSNKEGNSDDQDNEPLLVPGKYLMFQMGRLI